jgi:hypothetical protein
MRLKAILDTLEGLPEHFHELYTEKNGKFELTGIDGVKTQADVDRVNEALRKERADHKKTKERADAWGELNPDDVLPKLDRIEELEAAAKGKIDEKKIDEIVEGRVKSKMAPLEREKAKLVAERDQLAASVAEYQAKDRQRTIHDAVRKAATEGKVVATAVDDVLLLAERLFDVSEDGKVVTRDNVGVTPGVEPSVWLTETQEKRPHWWGPSAGGGAQGSKGGGMGGGSNPFSREHWNMTEQGRILRENPARAEQLAKSAGTSVGGQMPAERK